MRLLDIEVLPSFWETPFAYFLYVLFVLLIIITAVYILFTIYRLKHEVVVEQHMTDMKLRFFTDISHELRTPLTLISGPVEYVLEHTQLPADAREQLQVVERNTNRMLRLINQILERLLHKPDHNSDVYHSGIIQLRYNAVYQFFLIYL